MTEDQSTQDKNIDRDPAADTTAAESKPARPTRSQLLVEEGDIAADYLEEFLDIADIDGDIDIDVADNRPEVAIVCEDDDHNLSTLVGRNGQVLSALQELTRLAVQASTGQRSWLMLDIDGYRDSRKVELRRRADEVIEQVRESGESYSFQPMNSFERKIIHDRVSKAGLASDSAGEGDARHVVVSLP
ncbi:single-stranded DNA-binding protein [Brevibacterium sp. 50QC2O2]|jgi:spoIIIJ-associated protein|uniref:Jag family protein n=1 Tax=Brevibacterium TaxID=1696 RepID=UPI00211CFD2A|nr:MULTISPECIES: R3H domain-containing nucleic acid-binding protein [unclassified Brevibacterium]MCQ9368684.1 single-stranded DNA-binding protein [Brevibacterium sp. 91QC2O2]MCQ9386437.1 single-stranded DNA-binding protein [Brevibacterium sp. 68QC2CO]MCQ9389517.1 single-stranded DNA-binding protein [Brevibacterium sp. 50QC2O2]